MKLSHTITLCIAGLLIASPVMAAKVYKWVDENGVTNFSEHPPRNTKTEVLTPKIGHSEPVTYDTPQEQPKNDQEQSQSSEPQSEQNLNRCEMARKNLETLQNQGRIRVANEDGSFRYLSAEEQQEQLSSTQKTIDESC